MRVIWIDLCVSEGEREIDRGKVGVMLNKMEFDGRRARVSFQLCILLVPQRQPELTEKCEVTFTLSPRLFLTSPLRLLLLLFVTKSL